MTTLRGMTMIELMIALAITVVITAGMAGMVSAVTAGSIASRDTREVMVRAAVAQARLDSYVNPARSVLARDTTHLVLWLNDSRQGGTVHLSEVRWLNWDGSQLRVQLAKFPGTMTESESLQADQEYSAAAAANWETIRQGLDDDGHLRTIALVDRVESVEIATDSTTAADARRVTFTITFATSAEPVVVPVSSSILLHQAPP